MRRFRRRSFPQPCRLPVHLRSVKQTRCHFNPLLSPPHCISFWSFLGRREAISSGRSNPGYPGGLYPSKPSTTTAGRVSQKMGFLERSRSLRRKETPFMRKKNEEMTTAQQAKDIDIEKDMQRTVKTAHGHKDSTLKGTQTPPSDLSRPRTSSKVFTQETHTEVPMPNSARNFAESLAFKLPNGPSRRASMTPSPRTTTSRLTLHANHSTPGVVFEGQRNPERSMTTPIEPLPTLIKKEETSVEIVAPPKNELPSAAPRKEPHLRKSKSGTWRSFFSRKQSKPPLPDFNPADVAPPPALPKTSSKGSVPAIPAKDGKRLDRNSISVDKTRGVQTGTRTQYTKSIGDKPALPQLKAANLLSLQPPSARSAARSPSAESAMSQYFDASSHTSGSMPVTPLQESGQRRLDVSIPAVEMERYSVMFEKLLKPQTSLMDRRQTMVRQLNLSEQQSLGRVSHRVMKCTHCQRRMTDDDHSSLPNLLHYNAVQPHQTSAAAPLWLLR